VDSITAACYNVVFTSLPIGLFSVLDRPVKDLKAYVRYPRLYDKRRLRSLTTASFWKVAVLLSAAHGAVVFFVPYYRCGHCWVLIWVCWALLWVLPSRFSFALLRAHIVGALLLGPCSEIGWRRGR
jgi:hypothetical protein